MEVLLCSILFLLLVTIINFYQFNIMLSWKMLVQAVAYTLLNSYKIIPLKRVYSFENAMREKKKKKKRGIFSLDSFYKFLHFRILI
jgi:accessory gene regulator protein AgrB